MRPRLLDRFVRLTCVAGSLMLLGAAEASASSRSTPLTRAERALEQNRFSEAARLYGKVMSGPDLSDSDRGRAWRGKLVAHWARAEDGTIQAALAAVAAAPEHPSSPGLLNWLLTELEVAGYPPEWDAQLLAAKLAAAPYPEVQSLLLLVEAKILDMQGRFAAADSVSREFAWLTDFLVLGPFENEGGSGLDEVYPPETNLDARGLYRDLRGCNVGWFRAVPTPRGAVDLGGTIAAERSELGYAWTHVLSDGERDAILHLTTTAAARVWVGSELVLDEPDEHAGYVCSYEIPAHLAGGWNSILVKLGGERVYNFDFTMRLTDVDGSPLRLPNQSIVEGGASSAAPLLATSAAGPGQPPEVPRGIDRYPGPDVGAGWLRRWIESMPGAPLADQVLLVRFLMECGFDEDGMRWASVLQAEHRGTALAEDIRAKVLEMQGSNEANPLWRTLCRDAPELLSARVEVLQQLRKENRDDEFQAALAKFRKDFPQSLMAELGYAAHLADRGCVETALATTRAALDARPRDLRVIESHLELARDLNRTSEVERTQESARISRPDRMSYRLAKIREAESEGRYDAAIAEVRAASAAGLSRLNVLQQVADLHEKAGRIDSAAVALKQAIEFSPRRSALFRELGTLYLNHGQMDNAVAAFQQALRFAPGDIATREKVRDLQGAPPEHRLFPKVDVDALTRRSLDWVKPEDGAVHLLHSEGVVVWADGTSEHRYHVVTRILTEAGAAKYNERGYRLDGRAEIARIVKPDGREVEADGGYGSFEFDEVEPGDLIELRTQGFAAPRDGFPEDFWFDSELQDEFPCLLSRLAVLVPQHAQFTARAHNVNPKHRVSRRGDWRLEVWEARRLPGVADESDMPPAIETKAWIDLSSIRSWDDIVRWYDGVSRNRTRIKPYVQSVADSLARLADGDSARIHRVSSFVKTQVRYDMGGFLWDPIVPRPATGVLSTGRGDCKDQSGLVIALLRALGIEAHFALVNGRHVTGMPYLPSPRFTHAVVRARTREGRVYWVDPTDSMLEFPNVPSELEGALALIVDPADPQFCTIAPDSPALDLSDAEIELTVAPDGTTGAHGRASFQGERASPYRAGARDDPDDLKEWLENYLGFLHPGAKFHALDVEVAPDPDSSVRFTYQLDEPDAVSHAGELMLVSLPWLVNRPRPAGVGLEHRKSPLMLDEWRGLSRESIRVMLPPGYEVASKPRDLSLACPQGRYVRTVREESEGVVVLESTLEVEALRVEVGEYDGFRKFVSGVHQAQRELLALRAMESGPREESPSVSER